jgi:uncharacterized OB-fold protein
MTEPGTDWLLADELAPRTDGSLAPLYEAARAGRLVMPYCVSCASPMDLEQIRCDRCGGPVTWRDVRKSGRVHAATTVHRREPGLVRFDGPYQVVDVELDSGHRIVMTTTAPSDQPLCIGQPVVIAFRRLGTVALPSVYVNSDPSQQPEVDR